MGRAPAEGPGAGARARHPAIVDVVERLTRASRTVAWVSGACLLAPPPPISRPSACWTSATSCTWRTSISAPPYAPAAGWCASSPRPPWCICAGAPATHARGHRRPEAPRLRHRHLHPQPAAAPRAHRSRHRVRAALPRADRGVATARAELPQVLEPSPNYSIREQMHVPWVLRRERIDVFHAPHYVLPPPCRCRSVVTIHDCIHLMFPQYLPNRPRTPTPALDVARRAPRRSTVILTVSEASKRDILRFFNVPPEKIVVIYNAIDERFWVPPAEEDIARVRERYQLDHPFVLYVGNIKPHKNLERLIEAFAQLRRDRVRRAEAADHRRRDLEVPALRRRCTATSCTSTCASSASCPTTDAGGALPPGASSCSRRSTRLRPAAARGDGERHAGGHLERVVAAGGPATPRCWWTPTTTAIATGIRRVC
jgi:hypothetical protein